MCSPCAALTRHLASASTLPKHSIEMGTIIERFDPAAGFLKGWSSFTVSTLAVVQLRKEVPEWSAIKFKAEAGNLWSKVGAAVAEGSAAKLKKLTTPSCYTAMAKSLKRPAGQRHAWEVFDVEAKVRSVRIGHHASAPERKFAQVTCSIDASIMWSISDSWGKHLGGVGSKEAPHTVNDIVVFERCITNPVEKPMWRMKEKWRAEMKTDNESSTQEVTDA